MHAMCSYVMQIRVPDNLGLLDFAIGLVDSNHHLPDGQVKFFWELKLQNYCRASRSHKGKSVQQSIALHFMPEKKNRVVGTATRRLDINA